jgi:hypothetical protein
MQGRICSPCVGIVTDGSTQTGFTRAYFKSCIRFPFKYLLDEHIVAVATGKTARRVRIIFSAELNARNRLDDGHEFVAFDSIAYRGQRPWVTRRREDQVMA